MSVGYNPQVDDYVIWKDSIGNVLEGWVYFVCDEYVTIEISVRDKPDDLVDFHKKVHCCVHCFAEDWHKLRCVDSR